MSSVALEAQIAASSTVGSRISRLMGLSVSIKDPDGPSPFINARPPKVMLIDESKFTVSEPVDHLLGGPRHG